VTQEFHISITPVGDRDYLVRTERVEPGVPLAEEQVTWPVDRWLHQARSLMQDPLIQMLQLDDAFSDIPNPDDRDDFGDHSRIDLDDPLADRGSRSAQDLVSLGKELFNALFCDSLRDSWMMAQAIAQHRQEPLRLRLGIKGEPLSRLPWEVLHDLDQPLATGTMILFSRYRPSSLYGPRPVALATDEPLRILMVTATPIDQTELALTQETRALLSELQQSRAAIATMQISLLEHPDRHTLTQALEHGNYQIFHYAGHSISGPYGGAVSLVSEKTGLTERLSGEDLAGLLANNGIQLAVFNSCRGAHRDPDAGGSGASNLAEASIDRRIPAVLAMAERIPDDVALSLTRLFYRNLSQGVAIDLSLSRARQGLISSFGSRQLYWALPVFYLHPEFDGQLIAVTALESDPFDPSGKSGKLQGSKSGSLATSFTATDAIPADLLPDRLPDDTLLDGLTAASIAEPIDEPINLSPHRPQPTQSADQESRTPPSSTAPAKLAAIGDSGVRPGLTQLFSAPNSAASNSPSTSAPASQPTPVFILGIGLTIGLAIGLLGWHWWQNRPFSDLFLSQTPIGISPRAAPLESSAADVNAVVSQASTQIARNDWANALPIIEQLLDLGAVEQAGSLLALIPLEALDRADVQFLKGRWAWQTRVSGQLDASYDDAWRFWTTAVERQPENLLYRTALGWAYYADDRLDEADRVWREAIALRDQAAQASDLSIAGSALDRPTVELSLQAGLALTLDRRDQGDAAIALRDLLLTQDALALQPTQLAQNWLWSAEAIGQWQTLLARRPVFAAPETTPNG